MSDLDNFFNPKSIAVVGVSSKGVGLQFGGANFVNALQSCGFKGNIYPVNPKGGEVLGLHVYPSLMDIPGSVDYVICCISISQVPQLINECVAKGVKAVHLYTGGFSESGSEEGKRIEQEIASFATQSGIHIIGPNCMGIYCPKTGLSFASDFSSEPGSVAVICQSGGHSFHIIREGAERGVKFSKLISYGNACDVNESDLIEFLAADEDTRVIAAYIEGVKDGKRFARVLAKAAKVKPVIILKGGITESGSRAAASHTGSMAGSEMVWDGLLHQANAIRVHNLEELVDMALTFSYLPIISGRKVGILGGGGGATVLAADDCIDAGLTVPRFSKALQDTLRNYLKKGNTGVGLSNPVDLSDQGWDIFYDCIKTMLDYNGIDLLIFHMAFGIMPTMAQLDGFSSVILNDIAKAHNESDKPMVAATYSIINDECWQAFTECRQKCREIGVPCYYSLINAARAISRFCDYHEHRNKIQEQGAGTQVGRSNKKPG